jgi:O-succinylbenzoate synthase
LIQIDRIILREIRLPLKEPFQISSGIESERRIFLLELLDADGTSTWSECVAGAFPNYSPEAIDTAWVAVRDWIGPLLVGQTFSAPGIVGPTLTEAIRGNRMAIAAVEMGCWALESLKQDLPLARLLGGTREKIGTGISIGIQDSPAALATKASAAVAEGYRKIKAKIKPGSDIEFVEAARAAVGNHSLMVDANNAYTLDDIPFLKQLDEFDLTMIEQPLAWDDVYMHSRLQKLMSTPICLDESITSVEKAREMIELDSGRIINIKAGRVGGFSEAIAIHDLAAGARIPVWCGGMLESGVGRAYNVALASLPNFSIPGDISPSSRYWTRDVVTPEWTMDSEGYVSVPEGPGLGIEIDTDRIDDLTVRAEQVGNTK